MPSLDEKYTQEAGHEPSKKGRRWNELKSRGMLKWGKRKKVQFLRNDETEKLDGEEEDVRLDRR
ncbi:hypothetical protein Pint_17170 [Pistacia integerrima]|uniref:Uncharacterized protein n=1 Tax=Pistacia integerrima TaxID=434235 RepID=A0ACC0Z1H0_9ROSI|nr:hypothetical protein Pint_17170 [Pistacia integerrima]